MKAGSTRCDLEVDILYLCWCPVVKHVRYFEQGPLDHASILAYLGTVINDPPGLDRSPWEILVSSINPASLQARA